MKSPMKSSMKSPIKSTLLFLCLSVLLPFTLSAQVNVVGKWKIIKYDMDVTVGKKSEQGTMEAKDEYIYEFLENKTFKGNGWLNPFRGGINNNKLEGTYALTGNELKITCKKDDDEKNSYFYYNAAIVNDQLILTFDKKTLIKWFKDSDNPDDAFGKQLSQTMFSALDCKIYLQKVQ